MHTKVHQNIGIPICQKKEIALVKQIARRELNTTDNYIDNKNKWLYNKFGDRIYFALYSIEDTNEPTVLYACKGDRAEFEYEFLLIDILGREDIDEYTNKQKQLRDYLLTTNMTKVTIAVIVIDLWDEEATQEMLDYILETQEDDPAKLYEIACEISEKYKSETEEDWDKD